MTMKCVFTTPLDPFCILHSSALLSTRLQQQGHANRSEPFIQGGDKWYFHIVELISATVLPVVTAHTVPVTKP